MSRKQLLVVTERYWPEGSGGELATHLILEVLRKEFNIVVLTGMRNPTKLPGVQYIYEPLLAKREKVWLWLNASRLASSQRFQKMLKESDVVYIPRFSFPVIPVAKRFGKNVIVHLHDYIPLSYTAVVLAPYEEHRSRITRDDVMMECRKGLKHCVGVSAFWWLPRLARRWVLQADRLICVSKRQAEIISDAMPTAKERLEVIYNPPPIDMLANELTKELDDASTFLYVGGDSYIKGFYSLLRVIKLLNRHNIKIKFIFAGNYSPESIQHLKALGERVGGLEIQVVGNVKHEEISRMHQRVWALLFPSISEEPLPFAVVEAMLSATVPIASRVGGVPELLKDTPAESFMFMPTSEEEMARKILQLLTYSAREVLRSGSAVRRHALRLFSTEVTRKKLYEVFKV